MSKSSPTGSADGYALSDVVGAVADVQTYKNLLYLCLAFPLGLVYYVGLTLGFALGVALSVLVVGLVVLLVTVVGVRFVASAERRLANALLGTTIVAPDDVDRSGDGVVETAKAYLRASSTWRGLGFVVLKFPVGVLSFVLLVTFLGTAIELLALPLFPEGVLNVRIAGWQVPQSFGTPTRRLVAVPLGAVLGVVAVNVLNAFARANASIATSLLGADADAGE